MQHKTYLKGAVYVLVLAGLCVIPFALAQRNNSTSNSAPGTWQLPMRQWSDTNSDTGPVPVPSAYRVR